MLKRAAMGKDITIFTSANRISLIKTFSGPDLKVKPFRIVKDFITSDGAVFELKSLAEVLQRHHSSPNTSLLATAMAKAEMAVTPPANGHVSDPLDRHRRQRSVVT